MILLLVIRLEQEGAPPAEVYEGYAERGRALDLLRAALRGLSGCCFRHRVTLKSALARYLKPSHQRIVGTHAPYAVRHQH